MLVRWIEVWTDPSSGGAFLQVLRELDSGEFQIINPHRSNEVVATFGSYDGAKAWLVNDEYELVTGRTEIDDEPADS